MILKTTLITVGLVISALALILLLSGKQGVVSVQAQLVIQAGVEGKGGLQSSLTCRQGLASGSGLFSHQKAAALGCARVKQAKQQLIEKQASCPQRSLTGPPVYSITGRVAGRPVNYQTFANICSQRMNQFVRLAPLIAAMQMQIKPPEIQMMITPPSPPSLTKADVDKAERLVKRLGLKGYQRYVERTSTIPRKPARSIKSCPKPLPKFFVACLVAIQPRNNETAQQAIKRFKVQHPDWFSNDGPDSLLPPERLNRKQSPSD